MRVLVIAGGPVTGDDLRSALADEQTHDAEVMIIGLPHASAIRFQMSDADEAIASAEAVLPGLGWLDHLGLSHDEDLRVPEDVERDVVTAISDALAGFRPDRVLLFVAGRGRARERIDPEALEFELGIPVERVEVAPSAGDAKLNGRWSHTSA